MGQRVAFATYQNDFTGNAGFSGFPFRIVPSEFVPLTQVGPGTAWPFALTLTECIEFWWRIKKIDIGTITFNETGEFSGFTISGNIDSDRENEIDLVINDDKQFYKNFGEIVIVNDEEYSISSAIITEEIAILKDGFFYLSFYFLVRIIEGDFQPLLTVEESDYEVGSLTYNGKTVPVFNSYDITLLTPEIILTPSEYYAYAATDGSPIYNTTTGARLQDPRN
jgi:hypothetical protein